MVSLKILSEWKQVFTDKAVFDRLMFFYIFFIFFFQVFDVYATKVSIEQAGVRELNPVMRNFIENQQQWAFHSLTIKTVLGFLFLYCYIWLTTKEKFWQEKYLKYLVFGITFVAFFLYAFVTGIHIANITYLKLWGVLF